MKIVTPRRLALLGATTTAALLAGLLVAPTASAAVLDVDPGVVSNSVASQTLTFRTDEALPAGTFDLVRVGGAGAGDTVSGQFAATAPTGQTQMSTPVNFADGGSTREQDGPANPGTYSVRLTSGGTTSTCTGCFVVSSPGAPVVTQVSPATVAQGSSPRNVTLTGANFTRGSVVQVLKSDGTVDPAVDLSGTPTDATTGQPATNGITTSTTLVRRLTVSAGAVTGPRSLRVRNTDGLSGGCDACLTVTGAPLTGVSPSGESNTSTRATPTVTLTFRGVGLERGTPSLVFVGDPGSATREALQVVGTGATFASDKQSVTAQFDLRNAAPGRDVYRPTLTQADGSSNTCTCTFDVEQTSPAAVTAVSPATQQAASTQTVQITGSGLSRGVRLVVGGGEVTTTSVRVLSPTRAEAVLAVTANAVNGPRDVTPITTDGRTGTPCTGCYTITGGRTSTTSPSATPTATTSARPSSSPSATASPSTRQASVRVSPSTITSQEAARVLGTATPGSLVELRAYSRPSTRYVTVRRGVVGQSGQIEFEVRPSGNTRLFLRATDSAGGDAVDSASVVLTVRTSINLKVVRTGDRTYRFTGSTLPKRAGQTVNVRYRSGTGSVVAAKVRVAANGTYAVTRRFTGTGTFTFFTQTGVDINNAAGTSNAVRVAVR